MISIKKGSSKGAFLYLVVLDVLDAETSKLVLEARHASAAVHKLRIAARPSWMCLGVNV